MVKSKPHFIKLKPEIYTSNLLSRRFILQMVRKYEA